MGLPSPSVDDEQSMSSEVAACLPHGDKPLSPSPPHSKHLADQLADPIADIAMSDPYETASDPYQVVAAGSAPLRDRSRSPAQTRSDTLDPVAGSAASCTGEDESLERRCQELKQHLLKSNLLRASPTLRQAADPPDMLVDL